MEQTALHLEEIDATHMAWVTRRIDPVIAPAQNAAVAKAKDLLGVDMGLGRGAEEVVPKLCNGRFAGVGGAIGRRIGIFEDTVVGHQLHHSVDIMAIEGFVELKHQANR